jgi:hypothetical protein
MKRGAVENRRTTRRKIGVTHLPTHVVERILNLLEPSDARLLAELLNDASGESACYFFDGRWVVDPLFPESRDPEPFWRTSSSSSS